MYEIFLELLKKKGVRAVDVANATGLRQGVFTDWKMGRYTPKMDKMQLIADYFGVTVEYLMTGKEDVNLPYYNDGIREIADFLWKNPKYMTLFETTSKVREEDIDFVKEMIERASR